MDLAAEVLAGEPMRALMNETDHEEKHPELHQVGEGLLAEVVVER